MNQLPAVPLIARLHCENKVMGGKATARLPLRAKWRALRGARVGALPKGLKTADIVRDAGTTFTLSQAISVI